MAQRCPRRYGRKIQQGEPGKAKDEKEIQEKDEEKVRWEPTFMKLSLGGENTIYFTISLIFNCF